MFDKAPLPKHIAIFIMVIILAIMAGGYGLYYNSKKLLTQKDREFSLLKEKEMHAEENYNDLKKKFDGCTTDLKQVNKDYEILLQKHQECKEKQEELQKQYDELLKSNDALKKEVSPQASSDADKNHPIQMLNKSQDNSSESQNTKEAKPTGLQCPSSDEVSKNASTGTWKDNDLTWWVAFTSRPLNDNEMVKNLFKMLYDGHSIACYYSLNSNEDNNVWIVVKADAHKTFKISEKGWKLCPTDECKSLCEKDGLKECTFTIE
ncbi:MAG: hypothetical protein JSR17_00870 [Proteobacteria bacterium]|nr:hypothetical protein [Pseudomonadota bacterium]